MSSKQWAQPHPAPVSNNPNANKFFGYCLSFFSNWLYSREWSKACLHATSQHTSIPPTTNIRWWCGKTLTCSPNSQLMTDRLVETSKGELYVFESEGFKLYDEQRSHPSRRLHTSSIPSMVCLPIKSSPWKTHNTTHRHKTHLMKRMTRRCWAMKFYSIPTVQLLQVCECFICVCVFIELLCWDCSARACHYD